MVGFLARWKANYAMQAELVGMFDHIGINFMHLHPTIHRAVLGEAIQKGSAIAAFVTFVEVRDYVNSQEILSAEGKMQLLLSAYQELMSENQMKTASA